MDFKDSINSHYGRHRFSEKLLNTLKETYNDISSLPGDVLEPLEEFHIGGRKATYHLANLAGLIKNMHVLDIGCGIGGPARALANAFECNVVGVDITKEFCLAGSMLSRRTNLDKKIQIVNGSASFLPFKSNCFDVIWMQHSAVNILDKEYLFQEIGRLLRSGGKLAFHELFKSSLLVKHFPLPWAQTPETNFLKSESDVQNLLKSFGFSKIIWEDATKNATESLRNATKKSSQTDSPAFSLLSLMDPNFPLMAQNVLMNLEEYRLKVIFGVYSYHGSR